MVQWQLGAGGRRVPGGHLARRTAVQRPQVLVIGCGAQDEALGMQL